MAGRGQRIRERAYALWEAEGRPHGNDWADWFRAEAENAPLRVTFDSNVYQHVTRPQWFPKDPLFDHYKKIQAALRCGDIQGFLADSIATMEGVRNDDRPEFLTTQDLRPRIVEIDPETMVAFIAPDESGRPPLKGILIDRMREAANLGMRLMRVPFYNEMALPTADYALESEDFKERFFAVSAATEKQGVGGADLTKLGQELAVRKVGSVSYGVRRLPRVVLTEIDKKNIALAVREAADSDAIAAHIAFGSDLFCSRDHGRNSRGASILNDEHRSWLEQVYNVKFPSPEELAELC